MIFSANRQQSRVFLYSLPLFVITAWFSVGYHHPDEHFQVLEFCNYKLGLSSLKDLPWEYLTYCRPTVQPFIAYCFSRLAIGLGLYNPFIVSYLLRLLMGGLTWTVACRLVVLLTPGLKTGIAQKYFAVSMLLLWFVPYIGVRFSAETVSSLCFFGSMCLLLPRLHTQWGWQQVAVTFFCGFLFGLAVFVRLQLVFALFGLGLWLLFNVRWAWQKWLMMAVGAIVAIGICVLIDHWFYGIWVFTPYNYFSVNILQNKAASFGVSPWWYYVTTFLQVAGIPLSVLLLLLFINGLRGSSAPVFSFVLVCFVLGHMAVGHKEMRFLFPVSFAFIFLVITGLDNGVLNIRPHKGYAILLKIMLVFNGCLLVFKLLTPAEEAVKYYKFMYDYAAANKTTILYFQKSPYNIAELEVNFYKNQQAAVVQAKNSEEVAALINSHPDNSFIYLSQSLQPDTLLNGFKTERIYSAFPDFLLANNFNHWQERSRIWAVYRVSKK